MGEMGGRWGGDGGGRWRGRGNSSVSKIASIPFSRDVRTTLIWRMKATFVLAIICTHGTISKTVTKTLQNIKPYRNLPYKY